MNSKGNTHLQWNDRLTIERMLKEGFSKADIAKAVGKCERTIYYELERGKCKQMTSEYEFVERYCPEVAQRKYDEYLRAKGPDLKIGHDHAFAHRVEELVIDQHFSPGAALAEIRNKGEDFDTDICENTLYNYIYRGDVFLNLTPGHLHDKGRRHYAANSKRQAARAPRGESIEKRPPEIKERQTFGHWELDSVMGCKDSKAALLVLLERLTRKGLILLVPDHTSASVVQAINELERQYCEDFPKIFKSITVDNGCEFQDFEGIERSCLQDGKRTKVYFCHPYSAYERGSNENINRLVRRFFPKGTNFDEVQVTEVQVAEQWINDYPRKLLGWKSASMLYDAAVQAAA